MISSEPYMYHLENLPTPKMQKQPRSKDSRSQRTLKLQKFDINIKYKTYKVKSIMLRVQQEMQTTPWTTASIANFVGQ